MSNKTKKKQILLKEKQDAEGISRKKSKGKEISIETFMLIKILLLIAIPVVYFIYSPLLLVLMILYVCLFFLARMAERKTNKSVIKSNHIHISKFDSALALILIIVAFCGAIGTVTSTQQKGTFERFEKAEITEFIKDKKFGDIKKDNFWNNVGTFFTNFGSLLTGSRNSSTPFGIADFGFEKPPEDFIANAEDFQLEMKDFPKQDGFKFSKKNFSMDNVPVKYVFSSILSTINTILIFTVVGFGVASIVVIGIKKRNFEIAMNAKIKETKIEFLDDKEIDRILSFGEEVTNEELNEETIQEKIENQNIEDKLLQKENENLEKAEKEEKTKETKLKILDLKPEDEI